jgi:membrane associated rhomboid family serine protease
MPQLPPITKFLMLACTAVFCIQYVLPGPMTAWFALWPITTGRFWPWQVVSYAFLHGDVLHLFFNMFGLWTFGSELELLWGRKRFVHFLLASVLAAAAVQIVFTLLVGTYAPTLGASGALFGLLLAYGTLFPDRTIMPMFPPIPMKAKTFVVVFGALELFFGLQSGDGVAHFAHLGGMLGGYLMIRFWRGKPPFGRRGPRRMH